MSKNSNFAQRFYGILVTMLKKVEKFEEIEKIIKNNDELKFMISHIYGIPGLYIYTTENPADIVNSGIDILYNRFSIIKDKNSDEYIIIILDYIFEWGINHDTIRIPGIDIVEYHRYGRQSVIRHNKELKDKRLKSLIEIIKDIYNEKYNLTTEEF